MTPSVLPHRPAQGPAGEALPVLDEAAFVATQLVMSTHRSGWRDLHDALLAYEWTVAAAAGAAASTGGLSLYPTPRQAAMYLHSLRLRTDRDTICEDPQCPGGTAGPLDIAGLTAGLPTGGEPNRIDALAAATVRFVSAYHDTTPMRHSFLVYYWVRQTQELEELATTGLITGTERNAARVDYATGAIDLLHRLSGRTGSCEACGAQRASGVPGASTSLEALESWYAASPRD